MHTKRIALASVARGCLNVGSFGPTPKFGVSTPEIEVLYGDEPPS